MLTAVEFRADVVSSLAFAAFQASLTETFEIITIEGDTITIIQAWRGGAAIRLLQVKSRLRSVSYGC